MLTRQEFPYLRQLIINDCYARQNLTVPVFEEGQEFKHLILTGRNGSGKTTVLRALVDSMRRYLLGSVSIFVNRLAKQRAAELRSQLKKSRITRREANAVQEELNALGKVEPFFSNSTGITDEGLLEGKSQVIFAFFEANRKVQVKEVSTVTREDALEEQLLQNQPNQSPAELFKQYLVNKKIYQVFDAIDGKGEAAHQQEVFFSNLEKTLKKIFEDRRTKLEFVRENFEFFIHLSDGRRFTFNQLSAGFSAFLSILTELLMRTDLLRKQAGDYTYNPCGFVFIDEPETHLHLEMQYQILPLLTGLFPNLQFIVATHSPAVASSITGATVFDLSTGKVLGDEAAGSAYSELMQGHFGVENEFSNVADKIMADIRRIVQLPDHAQARRELLDLLAEKGRYMSGALRLEVEAQLLSLD